MAIDPILLERLVCPKHGLRLSEIGSRLLCSTGHEYAVVEDVPVLLDQGAQTLAVADASLERASKGERVTTDPFYVDTLGISESERLLVKERLRNPENGFDSVVSFLVGATNGNAYRHLVGKLQDYPIPDLRLPPSNGEFLLDVGCNWGRWCLAAAKRGYIPVGIDPSLGAILAAKRAAARLGLNAKFVVGDARFLPFETGSFDVVFSYSVLQHFERDDAALAIKSAGRVLRVNGKSFIQMPTTFGVRCLYHQTRRRFRAARGFEVRYWSIPALRQLFTENVGRTTFSVDCFFGIGLQAADQGLMPSGMAAIIRASEFLRKASAGWSWIYYVADSVYVESTKVNVI